MDRAIAEQDGIVASLERIGRDKAKPEAKNTAEPPRPISRWTFEVDARDELGKLNGTLRGSAKIAHGRLMLDGKGAFVETAPLPRELREKTLEAWVLLPNRTQRGGGVISVQTMGGATFDAIVFGENQAGKWMAGDGSNL